MENGCGLCVSPGDSDGFAEAVLKFYNNREMITYMGKNGRKFIETHITRKKSTKQILDCIIKVKNGGGK
jgi:glycosyltransferase involved in cell wall biosynthesis